MLDPAEFELPPIPSKHYFNIGEASKLCAVEPSVLRYWEQVFPQLSPVKRRGNRRSYRRHDVKLARQIKKLLHVDGFTTQGARAQLERQAAEGKGGGERGGGELGDGGEKLIGRIIEELGEVRDILR